MDVFDLHWGTSKAPSKLALELTARDGTFGLYVLDVVGFIYRGKIKGALDECIIHYLARCATI
jgi:hypothetical protein